MVNRMVLNHSGSKDDAYDLFQEVIILIYRKASENKLTLTSNFSTFLYSICSNLWLKELRKRRQHENFLNLNKSKDQQFYYTEFCQEYDEIHRYGIYQKHFEKLGKKCQKVLELFFNKIPLKEIMQKLECSSENYVKKLKYYCKEKLILSIQKDQEYQKYRYHEDYNKKA